MEAARFCRAFCHALFSAPCSVAWGVDTPTLYFTVAVSQGGLVSNLGGIWAGSKAAEKQSKTRQSECLMVCPPFMLTFYILFRLYANRRKARVVQQEKT
jgi:hypothetical protein